MSAGLNFEVKNFFVLLAELFVVCGNKVYAPNAWHKRMNLLIIVSPAESCPLPATRSFASYTHLLTASAVWCVPIL